jgi:isopentenyl phosphate kinase
VLQLKNPIIVKLGGSVITHKDSSPPRVNDEHIGRIAEELETCNSPLIVVLGGGAHGHQAAHKHGFGNPNSSPEELLAGIPDIHHNMSILATRVEDEMNRHNIPSVVFSPFSFVTLQDNLIEDFPTAIIKRTLESRTAVIIHGDVCFDLNKSVSILSGDTIAVYLAEKLVAKAVFIGTNVDGVLEENPQINPKAQHIPLINRSNINQILSHTGPSSTTDVTGGMAKKISELLAISNQNMDIAIFNLLVPGRLTDLLKMNPTICTRLQIS